MTKADLLGKRKQRASLQSGRFHFLDKWKGQLPSIIWENIVSMHWDYYFTTYIIWKKRGVSKTWFTQIEKKGILLRAHLVVYWPVTKKKRVKLATPEKKKKKKETLFLLSRWTSPSLLNKRIHFRCRNAERETVGVLLLLEIHLLFEKKIYSILRAAGTFFFLLSFWRLERRTK